MSAGEIDFWVSIGSTYSYLSVMRLGDVAKKTGLTFRWRPFSVRSIMLEQNNIPFRRGCRTLRAGNTRGEIAGRFRLSELSRRRRSFLG